MTKSGSKSKRKYGLLAMMLSAVLILCFSGCSGKNNPAKENPLFGQDGVDSRTENDPSGNPTNEAITTLPSGEQPQTDPTEAPTPEETIPPIVFSEVNETVYALERLNIRLEPSTDAAILRTMYLGEEVIRTGVSDEWSRILYNGEAYYVASAYLSMEPVIADTKSGRVDQLLPGMIVASETDQLILAVGENDGGELCTVYYYTKDAVGDWQKQFETEGFWGFNGVKRVIVEADGCTPAGCFPFRFAFGIHSDPGAQMEYRQATPDDYVVDDVNSIYYNRWVSTADPDVTPDWVSAEHIIDFTASYNYALFIENNPDCDTTQGSSAIFIHCTSPRGISPGCINIAEEHMITLVKEVRDSARIVIVYGVEDLKDY